MANIYDHHDKAFSAVSAFVVVRNNKRVATVAFKFPNDGAGRLWCYLHIMGAPMARGFAGGYGYDKRSAAIEDAAHKHSEDAYPEDLATIKAIKSALSDIGGNSWDSALRDAGFEVWQAV